MQHPGNQRLGKVVWGHTAAEQKLDSGSCLCTEPQPHRNDFRITLNRLGYLSVDASLDPLYFSA